VVIFKFSMHMFKWHGLTLLIHIAFTVKVKASTDVELGSVSKNDSLDDSKMEPNVYINPLTGVAGTYCLPSCVKNCLDFFV